MTVDPNSAAGTGTPFDTTSGFGRKPCLVIIDFCNAYVTAGEKCYCPDPDVGVVKAVAESADVLQTARAAGIPIIYTRVTYQPGLGDGGVFTQKVPMLNEWTEENTMTHIVPSLTPKDGEMVLIKKYPSAFFGTPLAAHLTAQQVDTVLLIGCSTSGCIRATALDAMQHGFRAVVVRECVGDRTKAVHDANLFDIQAKIGDVLPKAEVLSKLKALMKDSSNQLKPDGKEYKKGERDWVQNAGDVPRLKYDFDSSMKVYTNGVEAQNKKRSIQGGLTGRTIRLPDVNSGYPKCLLSMQGEDERWLDLGQEGFPDFLEHKRKFMVVIPSTNTTVEHDYWRMLFSNPDIEGIGFHSAPILIAAPKLSCDEDMLTFLVQFRKEILRTVDIGMTAEPEYLIMGMSLETFFGGWEGNRELMDVIGNHCGLSVATGAEACKYALEKFKAKKISVITPYQTIGDTNVVKFFNEIGFEVLKIHGFKCGSATDIAHVPESICEDVIRKMAVPDANGTRPDAIVQCGTNLSMISIADKLEAELGLPIIAINAATLWFALRENGFTEPLYKCTRLCREF